MPTPEALVVLVDSQDAADAASTVCAKAGVLALDTEFARTDTFRARLCLLQILAGDSVFCVDMLAPLDAGPLWSGITANPCAKILHAAKQDMEVFAQRFGTLPAPLFDTQVAAALLGHPPQAGYATLVEAELGIVLDKSQTRTDWSRRPLTAAQIAYAGNDVLHLPELAARLGERLRAAGREAWASEDSATVLDPALYALQPETAWERLGGIEYQPPVVQARARRLAAWRELRADRSDRPRQWILADEVLQRLAAVGPMDIAGIEALGVVPAGVVRHSGAALLAELRAGEADLESGAVAVVRRERTATVDAARAKELGALVQNRAQELGVASEILATRGEIASLLRGARDSRPLRGWRREVIGQQLLAAL
ncbi:MAG: ribonuclease D [Gammaproteobacteria bacterium]|nr:ribonuclease D [Gammaproteobacteria bacterium]